MLKTYQLSRRYKWFTISISILVIFLLLAMIAGIGIFRDPIKWALQLWYSGGTGALWFLLFIPLVMAFFGVLGSSQNLTLDSSGITSGKPSAKPLSWLKKSMRFSVPYSEIVKATYHPSSGNLRFYSTTHMIRLIPVRAFENGEEIINTLRLMLGEKLIVQSSADWFWSAQIFSLVMSMLFIMALPFSGLFSLSSVWTPVLEDSIMMRIRVDAYSLDEDGRSVWIVDDGSFSDDRRVWKATGSDIQVWEGLQSDYGGVQIGHDESGKPVLIKNEGLHYWQDGTWKFKPFESPYLISPRSLRPSVTAHQYWQAYAPVSVDFFTGKINPFPLPQDGARINSIRVNQDGSLLAEVSIDSELYLSVYRDGNWLMPGYPLDSGAWGNGPTDFCIDSSGIPWVLFFYKGENRIGRYSPERQNWDWWPIISSSDKVERYTALQVDSLGRVWLQGDIGINDFVRVYEALPDGLHELIEYNRYNSGFQPRSLIMLGPDRKMWISGNTVAYIDSSAPALPKPLPTWLAFFRTMPGAYIVMFFYLLSSIFLVITTRRFNKPLQ